MASGNFSPTRRKNSHYIQKTSEDARNAAQKNSLERFGTRKEEEYLNHAMLI